MKALKHRVLPLNDLPRWAEVSLISLGLGLSILTGCGGGHNPDLAFEEGASYKMGACQVKEIIASGQESRLSFASLDSVQGPQHSVEGFGELLFLCPLEQVQSQHSFELSFELEEGGSVTFVSFANGELQHGFEIEWRRQHEELVVQARSGGVEQNWSGPSWAPRFAEGHFASVHASKPLQFTVDIHNWETPAHVLIWQGLRKPQRQTPHQALFNSATDTLELKNNYPQSSPGNGQGRFWGLRLDGARITGANFGAPLAGH